MNKNVLKRLREQLEARKRAEDEAARVEALFQAEQEREEAEVRRIEDEKQQLKEARRLKLQQLKREGKLLTGKAKEDAKRRAAIAAQMLAKAVERGFDLGRVKSGKFKESVANGVESVANGVESVANGVESVANGVESVANGVESVANGVESVANGVEAGGAAGAGDETAESHGEEWEHLEYESSGAKTPSESNERRNANVFEQVEQVEQVEQQLTDKLRSPICCVLGHVDVGKTRILDNIRRTHVQEGEAGGITQQVGAAFVPADVIERRTEALRAGRAFELKLPGLLVIDTPGHEAFANLRQRGSGLCDMAVLVVDLTQGLEPQSVESIGMLRARRTPFVVALNKVDRLYGWKSEPDAPIRASLERQVASVRAEFESSCSRVLLQLSEQGLNASLYWKNPDARRFVSIVPTSARTGEGIPDLLQLVVKLTQTMMAGRLAFAADKTTCTVLEVNKTEGLGTTMDVILSNGVLREGDKIVVCGMGGPLVTRIRALKVHRDRDRERKEVRAAMGVKVIAPGLESAVAGTGLLVVGPEDDEDKLKEAVMEDMSDIFSRVHKAGEGVCIQASTLGSLEALLAFLSSPGVGVPVAGMSLGPVHKRDVLRASVANATKPKYAAVLAFDVPVSPEARDLAQECGVKIFVADVIYRLFDQFRSFAAEARAAEKEAAMTRAVFPVVLRVLPACVFNKRDPIVLGVDVVEGVARVNTPLAARTESGLVELGRIVSMEANHKAVSSARAGSSVCLKIEGATAEDRARMFGRHFDAAHQLVSVLSRESIDALKQFFADEMTADDWRLVIKLKKVFHLA